MPQYQILVDVQPRHLPDQSAPEQGLYVFAYTITITNTGEVAAQLISRSWNVNDANGHTEKVRGLGVVGQQPLLRPGETFEYTSGTRLRTPTGTMHGSYFFVAEDGERFDADIPMFVLDALSNAGGGNRTLH
jgi:ApaG protein